MGKKAAAKQGRPGSYKPVLLDELAALDLQSLEECAKVEKA